jgi:lipopolysaccharide export system protein LptA
MIIARFLPKIFTVFLIPTISCAAKVDPLSKISITSDRAICSKNAQVKDEVIFKYLDNVTVELADRSTITSRELEIVGNVAALSKKRTPPITKESEKRTPKQASAQIDPNNKTLEYFKKITFSGCVTINNAHFKATADSADIAVGEKTCLLKGSVHVKHTQNNPARIPPIDIKSEAATIKIDSGHVIFAGSSANPVNTVIDLNNHSIIHHGKNKPKNKKLNKKKQPKKEAPKKA